MEDNLQRCEDPNYKKNELKEKRDKERDLDKYKADLMKTRLHDVNYKNKKQLQEMENKYRHPRVDTKEQPVYSRFNLTNKNVFKKAKAMPEKFKTTIDLTNYELDPEFIDKNFYTDNDRSQFKTSDWGSMVKQLKLREEDQQKNKVLRNNKNVQGSIFYALNDYTASKTQQRDNIKGQLLDKDEYVLNSHVGFK